MESKKDAEWTVLHAIRAILKSWGMVSQPTIANCFRHCGFAAGDPRLTEDVEEDDEEDDLQLATLAANFREKGMEIEDTEGCLTSNGKQKKIEDVFTRACNINKN